MRLQELTLENFKAFHGEHRLALPDGGPKRPIYLIGGLNGAGKTSLTQSVALALHGPRAGGLPGLFRGGRDIRTHYATWLAAAFNHTARAEGADQMTASVTLSDGAATLRVIRRWWFDPAGTFTEEELEVREDTGGATNQVTQDDGQALIDEVIPRHLLDFAIFDGEQIRRLDDTLSANSVRGALDRLLNLDSVERTRVELQRLAHERRLEGSDDGQRRAYESLSDRLASMLDERQETSDRLTQAESAQARTQRELDQLASDFDRALTSGATPDRLAADLVSLRERRSALRAQLGRQLGEWLYLWPAFELLPSLSRDVADERDQRSGKERFKLDLETVETLAERFSRSRSLRDKAGAPAHRTVQEWFGTEVAHRQRALDQATLAAETNTLNQFTDVELDDIAAAASGAARDIADVHEQAGDLIRIEERIQQFEELLQSANRDSATAQILRRRDELNVLLGEQRAAAEHLRADLDEQDDAVSAKRAQVAKVEQKLTMSDNDQDWVTTAEKTIEALDNFLSEGRAAASETVRARMLRNLGVLLRKDTLITDVLIDPGTHVTRLVGADGGDVELPSAAEHQLAAMAFIDAVLSAAENPLPVFVDTPLARLDSHHRRAVVRDFWPSLGRQVIVMSTDEEVVDQLLAFARPALASTYHIECDAKGRSTVTPDSYVTKGAS